MNSKRAAALLVAGSAVYVAYRQFKRLDEVVGDLRRQGPRWNVIIPAAVALVAVAVALENAEGAVKRAWRA